MTALARLIPGGSLRILPWMNKGLDLIPAILAGAWDASNNLDRAVVEQIAGGTPSRTDRTECVPFSVMPIRRSILSEQSGKSARRWTHSCAQVALISAQDVALLREAMLKVFGQIEF